MEQIRIHGRGGQGVVSAAELIALAAFYEGRDLKIIRVTDASVIAVRGTPINGKEPR